MENSLVESLLYHEAKPLDLLLNERFNEQGQFTALKPAYIVNFFMGLTSMLMSDSVRSKYGVERVFFTHYGKEKIMRLVILTNKKKPNAAEMEKIMKVRTFDYGEKQDGEKFILSDEEYGTMKYLLSREANAMREELPTENLEQINLDQYSIDYDAYAVNRKPMHKVEKPADRTIVKLEVRQTLSNEKFKKQLQSHYIKDPSAMRVISDPDSRELDNPENEILLFTNKKIIKLNENVNFDPNAVPDFYDNYYGATGSESLEHLEHAFNGDDGVAQIFKKISSGRDLAAECGFTHGLLFFFSFPYPSYTEVKQVIQPSSSNVYDDTIPDPTIEMILIHKPKFIDSEASLFDIPIFCLFRRHMMLSYADDVLSTMSITGQIGFLNVKLTDAENPAKATFSDGHQRLDIVDTLFRTVQRYSNDPQLAAEVLEDRLRIVRSESTAHSLTEKNYMSRYMAGWIISSEKQGYAAYSLLSKKGDKGSTKFLIKSIEAEENSGGPASHEGEEPKPGSSSMSKEPEHPSNIMLVITENELSDTNLPDQVEQGEEYNVHERLQGEDTIIFHIKQEYLHTTEDYLNENPRQDFTRLSVRTSYAHSKDILDAHSTLPLPQEKLSSFEDLFGEQKAQLEKLLNVGRYFASDQSEYEAFLDGLFLDGRTMKNTKVETSDHADTFYVRWSGKKNAAVKMNFKAVPNELTEENLKRIAVSATEEAQRLPDPENSNDFQFVFSETPEEMDVKYLDKEQLASCSKSRRRRSSLKNCGIDTEKLLSETDGKMITPKGYKSLNKIAEISNFMMLGFMVRDAIADGVNEHYGALAKDIGFLVLVASSPFFAQRFSAAGTRLINSGSKFGGYALRGLGFGIKRAISIYVFVDLVQNAIAYANDPNNTDAKLNTIVDGIFVSIDLLTITAEALGAGAVLGPIGEIGAALLILGLNIYQTVRTLDQIAKMLPLNLEEVADETLRAFFHLNPEDYIQELINEKAVNSKLAEDAEDYLKKHSDSDTYITASAEFVNNKLTIHGDTIIDMSRSFVQRVSRTSPGIDAKQNLGQMKMACYVQVEQIEVHHERGFFEKVGGFFSKIFKGLRSLDHLVRGDNTAAENDPLNYDGIIMKNTPTCHNAFGITSSKSQDKFAVFKLGNKSDLVIGYTRKPNVFLMAGGVKNVTGGFRDDRFVVGTEAITGVLDGSNGTDILDLSSFPPDELRISEDNMKYRIGSKNSGLVIQNLETIILPTKDTIAKFVNISVKYPMHRIVSAIDTNITIPSDFPSIDNFVVQFSAKMIVENHSPNLRTISYIIETDSNHKQKKSSLHIQDGRNTLHRIFFRANLWEITFTSYFDEEDRFRTIQARMVELSVSRQTLGNIEMIFKDGSIIRSNGTNLCHVSLYTNLTIPEIVRQYSNVVAWHEMILTAYSSTDRESIVISHDDMASNQSLIGQILHNSVDHATHMLLNGCKYLILINVNKQGKIENTIITSSNVENLEKVVIDLSNVIEFYSNGSNSFIIVHANLTVDEHAVIEIGLQQPNATVSALGTITIKNILVDSFYDKITIRNYGEFKIDPESLHTFDMDAKPLGILAATPINIPAATDIFILTPFNVEPFHKIMVHFVVDQLDHYSINGTTLVLTNFRYSHKSKSGNIITLFVEGFYTVDKMKTLQLFMADEKIDLEKYQSPMAPDFSQFWKDLGQID